jgi:hypothetical protein
VAPAPVPGPPEAPNEFIQFLSSLVTVAFFYMSLFNPASSFSFISLFSFSSIYIFLFRFITSCWSGCPEKLDEKLAVPETAPVFAPFPNFESEKDGF